MIRSQYSLLRRIRHSRRRRYAQCLALPQRLSWKVPRLHPRVILLEHNFLFQTYVRQDVVQDADRVCFFTIQTMDVPVAFRKSDQKSTAARKIWRRMLQTSNLDDVHERIRIRVAVNAHPLWTVHGLHWDILCVAHSTDRIRLLVLDRRLQRRSNCCSSPRRMCSSTTLRTSSDPWCTLPVQTIQVDPVVPCTVRFQTSSRLRPDESIGFSRIRNCPEFA